MGMFEPPKYVTSLIQAINDGAKTAQTGALALAAVGIYLLAVSVSTTDEDLLLGHTTSLAQLGVQVPPQISLGIAPLVFVMLHIFTLIRYDMLETNLRHLRDELKATVQLAADRERCLQLLANVEFVIARAAPINSPLRSALFGMMAWFVVVAFPVMVLLLQQGSALRFQEAGITWTHRCALFIDLLALIWFYRRGARAGDVPAQFSLQWLRQWGLLLFASTLVTAVDLAWLNLPKPDEYIAHGIFVPSWEALYQPLDTFFCPGLKWGCRYLDISNRTLIAEIYPAAVAKLRNASPDQKGKIAADLKGAFLRGRNLRSADLHGSALYGADLMRADLRRANLGYADLTDANATAADFSNANMFGANLSNTNLTGAKLGNVIFAKARLNGAVLRWAHLDGADLRDADLSGADLRTTNLAAANLTGAKYTPETQFPIHFDLDGHGLLKVDQHGAPTSP